MRRQRNMFQMKENKTPEKELNRMRRSNLLGAEFETLVIRKLNKLTENINSRKKDQSEMKDTLTAVRNSLQGINSRVDEAKIQISYLKSEQLKEKRIQNQLG